MSFTRDELRSAGRLGALCGLWVGTIALATYAVVHYIGTGEIGVDAHAYWHAGRVSEPYDAAPGHADAFEYSPVFLQLVRPLSHLPFAAFYVLWAGLELLAFCWLTSGLAVRWRIPVLLMCVPELCLANINALLGVALVIGLRRPEAWAFPALTKLTPAGVGFVWLLARGEIGKVVRGLIAIVVVSGVSYAFEPRLWHEWVHFLRHHSSGSSLDIVVRLAIAAVVAVLLARWDRAWLLPAPYILATPVFGFTTNQCLAMVPAALRLRADRRTEQEAADPR